MFDESRPEVIAVLDWELSTLGNPLCDLADSCRAYYLPPNFPLIPCTYVYAMPLMSSVYVSYNNNNNCRYISLCLFVYTAVISCTSDYNCRHPWIPHAAIFH